MVENQTSKHLKALTCKTQLSSLNFMHLSNSDIQDAGIEYILGWVTHSLQTSESKNSKSTLKYLSLN